MEKGGLEQEHEHWKNMHEGTTYNIKATLEEKCLTAFSAPIETFISSRRDRPMKLVVEKECFCASNCSLGQAASPNNCHENRSSMEVLFETVEL